MWKRQHPLSAKADVFAAKLAPQYDGPIYVRRIISPVVVDLQDGRGKWHRHVHVQNLKSAPADHAEARKQIGDGALGLPHPGKKETTTTQPYKMRPCTRRKHSSFDLPKHCESGGTEAPATMGRSGPRGRRRADQPEASDHADHRDRYITVGRDESAEAGMTHQLATRSTNGPPRTSRDRIRSAPPGQRRPSSAGPRAPIRRETRRPLARPHQWPNRPTSRRQKRGIHRLRRHLARHHQHRRP